MTLWPCRYGRSDPCRSFRVCDRSPQKSLCENPSYLSSRPSHMRDGYVIEKVCRPPDPVGTRPAAATNSLDTAFRPGPIVVRLPHFLGSPGQLVGSDAMYPLAL